MTLRGDGLFIGSMVTLAELIENPIVRQQSSGPGRKRPLGRLAPDPQPGDRRRKPPAGKAVPLFQPERLLARKCSAPASSSAEGSAIKSRASKVCRALYYSDLAPVLLAFDAAAEIVEERGPRTISLQDLIHRQVAGVKGKFILKGISVPSLPPGTWGKFLKAGVRSAIDFALADVAVRYSPADSAG